MKITVIWKNFGSFGKESLLKRNKKVDQKAKKPNASIQVDWSLEPPIWNEQNYFFRFYFSKWKILKFHFLDTKSRSKGANRHITTSLSNFIRFQSNQPLPEEFSGVSTFSFSFFFSVVAAFFLTVLGEKVPLPLRHLLNP